MSKEALRFAEVSYVFRALNISSFETKCSTRALAMIKLGSVVQKMERTTEFGVMRLVACVTISFQLKVPYKSYKSHIVLGRN